VNSIELIAVLQWYAVYIGPSGPSIPTMHSNTLVSQQERIGEGCCSLAVAMHSLAVAIEKPGSGAVA